MEFDSRILDDDWVCAGMELGLINNILNIGKFDDDIDNISKWEEHKYKDKRGKVHWGLVIGHIANENSLRGALGNLSKYEEFRIARNILGYIINEEGTHNSDVNTNFVLDFDLDCFTTECQGETFAWPESIFDKMYGYGEDGAGFFMDKIIQKAKFITICREPSCCGGLGESNKILSYLDYYFFKGSLGTNIVR